MPEERVQDDGSDPAILEAPQQIGNVTWSVRDGLDNTGEDAHGMRRGHMTTSY
jgi:hypothetical protein